MVLLTFVARAQLVAERAAASVYSLNKAMILVDPGDHAVVRKKQLSFYNRIFCCSPAESLRSQQSHWAGPLIIIGSADRSGIIQQLAAKNKLKLSSVRDHWEAFHISSIKNVFPGIPEALVITGSDARGTAFGVLEFSEQAGVSPWYWWADVPVQQKRSSSSSDLSASPTVHW